MVLETDTSRRGLRHVRVTRNDLAELLKEIQKKAKNPGQMLKHVGWLIAQVHLKHYVREEGPSEDGNSLEPWPELDVLYKNNPTNNLKNKNPKYRNKMLRNRDDEIFKQITSGNGTRLNKGELPQGAQISKNFVEVGIVSDRYWYLHEGMYRRKEGDTVAEKRQHSTYMDPNQLARRIIGITPEEERGILEDFEIYFNKELEDL